MLLGADHQELGVVDLVAEGPAAIGLSRGGARKAYSHVDPNEDAALFAVGSAGVLLAVADGHHGASGSALVIERLRDERADAWTDAAAATDEAAWSDAILDLFQQLDAALVASARERDRPPAPTTLSLALVRPHEDRLLYASIGDSHIFACLPERSVDLGCRGAAGGPTGFLGRGYKQRERLAELSRMGARSLAELRAVVLATDGLSEHGIGLEQPAPAVSLAVKEAADESASLRAMAACRAVVQAALDAHRAHRSGDNTAAAIWWPDGR